MTNIYAAIIESMRRQTEEQLKWPPEKLREWLRQIHGHETRELEGDEAKHMLTVLKLVGHFGESNNQRTHTYFYNYNGKEYRVTYGLGDEPVVEEI